jgi:hypothetical protein
VLLQCCIRAREKTLCRREWKKCNCTITNKFLSKMPSRKISSKNEARFRRKDCRLCCKRGNNRIMGWHLTIKNVLKFQIQENFKIKNKIMWNDIPWEPKVCGLLPQSFLYDLFILLPFLFLADFSSCGAQNSLQIPSFVTWLFSRAYLVLFFISLANMLLNCSLELYRTTVLYLIRSIFIPHTRSLHSYLNKARLSLNSRNMKR